VIYSWQKLDKFLNNLLIFLLPTQLALHFWPSFAFVFGTRVDYLAPSIYLTDFLFAFLFVVWVKSSYKSLLAFIGKNKACMFIVLAIAIINICFSVFPFLTLIRWLKFAEFVVFVFYVWARKEIFGLEDVLRTLYFSLIFFSLIGIAQFFYGHTIGGLLYFLGERTFNTSMPGIALIQLAGRDFLRAYSTFSHPNSFAGYLGVGIIMLILDSFKKISARKILGLLVIFSAFILTFSLSAAIGVAVCAFLFLFLRKEVVTRKNVFLIPLTLFLISLLLPFVSKNVLLSGEKYTQSIYQRLQLSVSAGKIISQKFFVGEGLNASIVGAAKNKDLGFYLWLLQPVHNIFLLVFSETGVIGLLLFYLLLTKATRRLFDAGKTGLLLAIVFIMVTGLFDHYWLTLQQNTFLFALILGKSYEAPSTSRLRYLLPALHRGRNPSEAKNPSH